jgi:hypothetical protein
VSTWQDKAKTAVRDVLSISNIARWGWLFVSGARWQREALLSDESVERAERALNEAGWTCGGGLHEPGEYDHCEDCREVAWELARVALTAAIGDGDE